ncbi:MAG TPA: hypothetical protein VGW14_06055 [Thermoleophilaceae bacterium]|nr:hypothetical protein [Thermoleophilaceae bacterium]
MDDLNLLFTEYKEAYRTGDGDPRPFLERAAPADRPLLAALIDAFLEEAPRRELSEDALGGQAAAVTDDVHRTLAGTSGLWPALLPRLRGRARLRRAEVVSQLAARLGAQGRQQEKVGLYYHQMEQGLLPESGVSDTVLEALGRIVGYTAEALRKAGQLPAPGPPRTDEGAAFARATYGEPAEPSGAAPRPDAWDEVDRLFRGGP